MSEGNYCMGAMLTRQAMWPVRFGGRRQDLGFESFILSLVARELRGQSQTQVSKLAGPRICDPPQKSDSKHPVGPVGDFFEKTSSISS